VGDARHQPEENAGERRLRERVSYRKWIKTKVPKLKNPSRPMPSPRWSASGSFHPSPRGPVA